MMRHAGLDISGNSQAGPLLPGLAGMLLISMRSRPPGNLPIAASK
jgi:hypothetical protein